MDETPSRFGKTPILSIRLLGPFEVWRRSHPIPSSEWRTRKAMTLLKILVHERGKPVSFARLHELLWPHRSAQSAANNLHTHLAYVRHVLAGESLRSRGAAFIRRTHSGYLFDPSAAWIDVDAFQAMLQETFNLLPMHLLKARAQMEKAAHLYRGDYLGDDVYEDWPTATRELLREQYLTLLGYLGRAYLALGQYAAAAATAWRIHERDQFREEGYRLLMCAQYFQGEKSDALLTYRRLAGLLARELDAEPAQETKRVAQAIKTDSLVSSDAVGPLRQPGNA